MDKFLKYFPLRKIDEATHTVWGVATSETPDHDKEICDYESAKAAIKAWSDDQFAKTSAAGQDPSLGNMRVMHQLQIGGKATKIEYHDAEKEVWVGSEPANEEVWHLLKGGFLTMHSIGGSYAKKWADGQYTRYAPTIGEISYVDKGSNPDAIFAYVKADGSTELRKFSTPGPTEKELLAKLQGARETLSDADVDRIAKALSLQLSTQAEKKAAEEAEAVRKRIAATGADMNKEQIEKCAKALGITVEEFTKTYIESNLLKGAKGMAAVHSHLEAMSDHHAEMGKCHKAMGGFHEKMGTHIEKCMKACGDVMGSEGEKGEKAFKALLDELAAAKKTAAEEPTQVSKTELADLIKAETQKALDEFKKTLPKGDAADGIRIVPRDADFVKAVAEAGPTPDPVIR